MLFGMLPFPTSLVQNHRQLCCPDGEIKAYRGAGPAAKSLQAVGQIWGHLCLAASTKHTADPGEADAM